MSATRPTMDEVREHEVNGGLWVARERRVIENRDGQRVEYTPVKFVKLEIRDGTVWATERGQRDVRMRQYATRTQWRPVDTGGFPVPHRLTFAWTVGRADDDEDGHAEWMESCARACRCCECAGVCAGVQAGGICDDMCFCGERDGYAYRDLADEDEDEP